jgi:ABC-2 type transport system ATP-binding protein
MPCPAPGGGPNPWPSVGQVLATSWDLPAPRIGELAAHDGLVLYQLATQQASLEEAFIELTRDSTEYGAPSVPTDAAATGPVDGGVR